jgi:hypothetical protein
MLPGVGVGLAFSDGTTGAQADNINARLVIENNRIFFLMVPLKSWNSS